MRVYYRVAHGCTRCCMCYYECRHGAITIVANVSAVIDADKCVGCGRCFETCASEAIERVTEKSENEK